MFGNDDFFSEIERAFFRDGGRSSPASDHTSRNVSRDEHSYVSNLSSDFDRIENGSSYFVVVNFLDSVSSSDLQLEIEDDFNDSDETSRSGFFSKEDKVLSIVNAAKQQSFLKIRIPKKVAKWPFTHTFNNGILEVRFKK